MTTTVPNCAMTTCQEFAPEIQNLCKSNGWPPNQPVLIAAPLGTYCYCYCGGQPPAEPAVAVPDGSERPMRTLAAGDTVSTFDPSGASRPGTLAFSEGTVTGLVLPEMVYVSFRTDTRVETLVVPLIHTFLRATDRTLIQAQMLWPGDQLMCADGTVATVTAVEVKRYRAGIWNVATAIESPESLDGHLIAIDGVLGGDFATQLFYQDLVQKGLATAAEDRAAIQQNIKAYGEAMGFIPVPEREKKS